MKKIFFVMLAAAGMAVTSCERSFDEIDAVAGGEAKVSVNLEFPTMQTRAAYSDGTTATHLQYAVFEKKGSVLTKLDTYTKTNEVINISKEIEFQLVTGRTYQFVFWAAAPSESGWTNPYTVTFTENGATMTADYTGAVANDERYDAFFASVEKTITGDVQMSVELTRPFAQINVGTSDYEVAKELEAAPTKSALVVKSAYKKLDLVTGDVDDKGDITFNYATIPGAEGTQKEVFPILGYDYLAMAYILVDKEKEVLATVGLNYYATVDEKTAKSIGSVPVQRNHRTNMFGQVLTSNASLNIIIVPEYEEPDHNYSQLLFAAAVGGSAVLDDDVEVQGELSFEHDAVVDLGGHEIKATGGAGGDAVVVKGGANVTFKNGTIKEAENAQYGSAVIYVSSAKPASVTLEEMTLEGSRPVYVNSAAAATTVTINSGNYTCSGTNGEVVYVQKGGKVVINGGTFSNPNATEYGGFLLNIKDDFRGTLNDPREAIEVRGGMFYNFDPANNKAEGEGTNFVAEGYKSVATVSGDDTIYVVVPEDVVVASDAAALTEAVKTAGATVQLMPGDYTFTRFAENVTIIGAEGVVCSVSGNNGMSNGATFKNVKFAYTGYYPAFTGCANLTYENCEFEGEPFSYAANAVYKNCTFYQTSDNAYNIWAYTSTPLTFEDCTFNCAGKGLLIYNEGGQQDQKVYIKNCKFIASQAATGKAAIEISSQYHSVEVHIDNCTEEGFAAGNISGKTLWNCKNSTKPVTIYVDGQEVFKKQ